MQNFVTSFDVTFPVLLDLQGAVYNQYRTPQGACTSPFPLDFILDRDGIIRYWKCEYDPQAMVEVIAGLIAGGSGVPDLAVVPAAERVRLSAAPNPFHPLVRIRYALDTPGPATLAVHDAGGRLVRLLHRDRDATAGDLLWDGRNDAGMPLPSGVYFLRLDAGVGQVTQKLSLIR